MARTIRESLSTCKTADAVAFVFETVKAGTINHEGTTDAPPPKPIDDTAIKSLAASIDALVMQATKAEVVQPAPSFVMNMPAINLTAQMPPSGTVTVNVPEQPAPIVNVTTPETIVNVAPAVNNITVQSADVIIPPAPTEATITTDRNGNRVLKVK
jgi:hypothetical protein